MFTRPYVEIYEQPAPDRARFRYECEGLSVILGKSSTKAKKTYPAIKIVGLKGKAVAVASCVTKYPPYRPHPFYIDGKPESGCKKGVCTVKIGPEINIVDFVNIAVRCVRKKDVEESLRERQSLRIDPFKTGFDANPYSYDYNSIRLCFQVFLEDENGKFTVPLAPIVSDPIYDKKNLPGIAINRISHCVSKVDEMLEIIILCSKVVNGDILVRFYEERNGTLAWEDYGSYTASYLHKQVAITFRAPKYKDLEIENPVRVYVQLKRPSDGFTSSSIPFEYIPSEEIGRKRKLPRIDSLVDLAKCFEKSDYNPIMNIREDKNHALPISPEMSPNKMVPNVAYNPYQLNLPSPSYSPQPINIPETLMEYQSESDIFMKNITNNDFVQDHIKENNILERDNSYLTAFQDYLIGNEDFDQLFR